jgi:dipeptidyl aminopeptidase/acylaminoacyl peptidase
MKFLAGAVVALLPWPVLAAAAEIPAKLFARSAEYESAKISPNGEYLAVATRLGDKTALGVIDVKQRTLTGGMSFARGESVYQYWWVSPNRVAVTIAQRGGPLDQPRWTGELYAMNADGSQKVYLYGYRGNENIATRLPGVVKESGSAWMEDPIPRDPKNALISVVRWGSSEWQYPSLERINVLNGDRKRLAVLPVYPPFTVAADEGGQPRLASGLDTKGEVRLYVAAADGAMRVTAYPDGDPDSIHLHGVSPDGKRAFLTGSTGGRECLREYRFESASFAELHCSSGGSVGSVVMAFDGSRPIALTHDGTPSLRLLDEGHADAKLLQALAKSFAGQRVTVSSQTLDANRIVLFVDADRNPGDYFLFDRTTRKAEHLVSLRSWIDPKAMQPVESFEYAARDGYRIQAYVTAPEGLATRKAPLVVLPHGGPHGVHDSWRWDDWAQFLASRGYAVLQPNYRGSGGYGKPHEQAGYRKWGTLMQDDLTDAVRWAVEKGIADPRRICIVGASYGGYAALMSATREPDLYRCAVGYAGIYDLAAQAADSDTAESSMGRIYLEKVLGNDAAVLSAQSPVSYVDKLKATVLIVHGTADKRVPFSQAKALRRALERHKKPYEWLEYAGEEHGFWSDANHEDFLNNLADFLDRHIGPNKATPAAAR